MTQPLCQICGRPQPDTAYVCPACADKGRRQLDTIAGLAPDARAVAQRQTRRGSAEPGGHTENQLPVNLAATSRLDAVTNTLSTWARAINHDRGGPVVANPRADPLAVIARYIVGHIEWVRHQRFAVEVFDDVAACARVISSLVDRPEERQFAGPCTSVDEQTGELCGAYLYARPGRPVATCRACGYEYDVSVRQEWMREQIEDRLARPVEIAGILLRLGVPLGYSTIAAYANKGRILPHGFDEKERPLFRIGDVLDIRMGNGEPRRVGQYSRGAVNLQEG